MINKYPTSRTVLIHLVGHLDAVKVDYYRQQIRMLIDEGDYRTIVFDMEEAPFISSSGLGLLIEFYNKVKRIGGQFRLIHCNEQTRSAIHQANLHCLLADDDGEVDLAAASTVKGRPSYDRLHALMTDELLVLAQIELIIEAALRADDPDAIAEIILDGAMTALRSSRGAVLYLTGDQDHLRLAAWRAPVAGESPDIDTYPLKIGRLEYEILESDGVRYHEIDAEAQVSDRLFQRLGFDRLLSARIPGRDRSYGLFVVEADLQTQQLFHRIEPIIETLARLSGLALEKTWLVKRSQSQNRELTDALERVQQAQHAMLSAGRLAALGTVISGLAHQLNNRMVPVLGYAQLLAASPSLPEDDRKRARAIARGCEEMHEMIEKALHVSRVRERRSAAIDPFDQVRVALDLLQGLTTERRIRVSLEEHPVHPRIVGDAEILLQAVLVILHRSCSSFGDEQRERWIRVSSAVDGPRLRLAIEDNGQPIEPHDREDWLDPLVPFEAISQGRIFSYTVPRSVVRRLNGNLELADLPDGGKRVVLDLPLLPAAQLRTTADDEPAAHKHTA